MLWGGLKGISSFSKFWIKDFDCESENDGLPCDVTSRLVQMRSLNFPTTKLIRTKFYSALKKQKLC